MKIITHEDQATLKKLIGKTFDNAAIACHKEARKGRVALMIEAMINSFCCYDIGQKVKNKKYY